MIITCANPVCKKVFNSSSSKSKYCSSSCFGKVNHPKGIQAWNKGLKGTHFSPSTEFKKGITPKNSVIFVSKEKRFKGTLKEYKALHYRITKLLGRPTKCEKCHRENLKRYHWANVSGNYIEARDDWMRLCPRCHYYFDKQYERKARVST